MKLIPYNSIEELNTSNEIKLERYKKDVGNVNADQFAEPKFINGVHYLPFIEEYKNYYTDEQKERIVDINIEENDNRHSI